MAAPDRARMEAAVAEFLSACGVPSSVDLEQTPRRVADAWAAEFLDGYGRTAGDALAETYPTPPGSSGLVVVSGLRFRSTCPHHLLPYAGVAHVGYLPGERIVGFGRLSTLVDVFSHRLILQEDFTRLVAEGLADALGARGAACATRAEQSCLRLRGEEQASSTTYSESYVGAMSTDAEVRARFARVIGP